MSNSAKPEHKPFRAGLISRGTIGREVERQLKESGHDVAFVAGRDWTGDFPEVDVVFLAIPTLDDGSDARRYIELFTDRGTPVVTCEKGALANFYAELAPRLDRIGLSATVGGGTRMLHYAQEQMDPHVTELHAVVNGTLNFIMDGAAGGKTLEQMVALARERGYAEPQAESVLDVLNGEAVGDVPKKAAILFNYCFSELGAEPVRAADVETRPLTEDDLKALADRAASLRYVVSITRTDGVGNAPALPVFEHRTGDWLIRGGFYDADEDRLLKRLVPRGVDNALLVAKAPPGRGEVENSDSVVGPGAGAEPTVGSMMLDARDLLAR